MPIVPSPPTLHSNHIRNYINKVTAPMQIVSEGKLSRILKANKYRHFAFTAVNREQFKCFCLNVASRQQRSIYVVDHLDDLSVLAKSVMIDAQGRCQVLEDSPLQLFFEQARQSSPLSPWLIIDWTAFNAREQVQLNTLLEDIRSIYGQSVPDCLQIISICETLPEEISFLSRHDYLGKVTCDLSQMTQGLIKQNELSTDSFVVDIMAYPDWQTHLFGPIVLIDNQIVWQKSTWVKWIVAQPNDISLHLILDNVPIEARQACYDYFARAKAQGYFDYHDYRITYPEQLNLTVTEDDFDFTQFKTPTILTEAQPSQIPRKAKIINSELFDSLLTTKNIINGSYQQQAGLLAQFANSSLTLWITSELSDCQWYCLFAEAKQNNVSLDLYLAKDVKLPADLATNAMAEKTRQVSATEGLANIVLTNKAQDLAVDTNALIIELDDENYETLFGPILYRHNNTGFSDFSYDQSDFVKLLQGDRPIVLRGTCSEELLQALHPLLTGKPLQLPDGRLLTRAAPLTLYLEVEPYQLSTKNNHYAPLAFLGNYTTVENIADIDRETPVIYREEAVPALNNDSFNTNKIANKFMASRTTALLEALQQHRMVQLVGPTGVGKSHLMKQVAEESSGITVYHDLENLAKWAQDTSDKDKVLFLDEANIINKHLACFIPLKRNNGECEIFYQGKFYKLSARHKIVFARNPEDYGGGRVLQQLFVDKTIPELHFADFPVAVLYEKMLLPLYQSFFYDPLGLEIDIDEATFKAKMFALLDDYQLAREAAKQDYDRPTVRMLQQQAYYYLLRHQCKNMPAPFFTTKGKEKVSTRYVELPSMREQRLAIHNYIQLHKSVHDNILQGNGLGLNGCYLEGPPGVGKSVMMRYMLEKNGYCLKGNVSSCKRWYDKIDASTPLDEMILRIIEAFDAGQVIILDELNSHADDGLEKSLNSVLAGIHPLTGKSAQTPGFMAFFTGNSIALSGRAGLSPALLNRCEKISFSPLEAGDIHKILKAQHPKLIAKVNMSALANDLAVLMHENKNINLRFILKHIAILAKFYELKEKSLPAFQPNIPIANHQRVEEYRRAMPRLSV